MLLLDSALDNIVVNWTYSWEFHFIYCHCISRLDAELASYAWCSGLRRPSHQLPLALKCPQRFNANGEMRQRKVKELQDIYDGGGKFE